MAPQQGPGRPRKLCESCRPSRAGGTVVQLGGEPAQESGRATLVGAVRARLAEAGRQDTVEGLMALTLAARIVNPATTGSAVAALTRELTAAMERALLGVVVEADPVADLAERRAAKAAGQ